MDAVVRNKCEQELLAIIKEVSAITGIAVRIETEAYVEGGLRERFRLFAKNQFVLTTFLAIITSLATTVPSSVLISYLTTDTEKEELEKRKLENEVRQGTLNHRKTELEIERFELENQQLKQQIRQHSGELTEASRTSPHVSVSNTVQYINDTNYKVLKHRSNFYKLLQNYPKVTHISFGRLTSENEEVAPPIIIQDKDFRQYVIMTDELPPLRDEEAIVEIISPVLKPGNYKWKGVYLKTGEAIDFYMRDQEFKDNVVRSRIPFRNGSRIACVLDISRRLTETGDAVNTSYAVATVTATIEGEGMVETPQGRDYRLSKNQLHLAFY